MRLLARPIPGTHESWPSYLLRLAQLNQLNGLQGIADMLGILPYRLLVSSPRNILTLLGVTLPREAEAVLDTPLQPEGSVYLARAGRTIRSRICPACAREDQDVLIPAEWDAALSFRCDRHEVALLDACPACGIGLTYERSRLSSCDCGYGLWMVRTTDISSEVEPVLRALSLPIHMKLRPALAPSTQHEVVAAWLIRRLQLVDAGPLRARRAPRFKGEAFVSLSDVRSVAPWFSDWPNGFLLKLGDARRRHADSPSELLGLAGSNFKQYFPEIAAALREFDRRRRTGKRPVLVSSSTLGQKPWMGIKQLMRQTGCCYHTIQNWIRFGWLGEVRIEHRAKGGSLYFIDMAAACRAIEIVKQTSSIRHSAKDIGLEPASVMCLVRAGVIQCIPFGSAKWNVRVFPAEVFKLAQGLLNSAVRGRPTTAEVLTISTALCRLRTRAPCIAAEFIAAILAKRIVTRTFIRAPVTLEEITLRSSDFSNWLRNRRD